MNTSHCRTGYLNYRKPEPSLLGITKTPSSPSIHRTHERRKRCVRHAAAGSARFQYTGRPFNTLLAATTRGREQRSLFPIGRDSLLGSQLDRKPSFPSKTCRGPITSRGRASAGLGRSGHADGRWWAAGFGMDAGDPAVSAVFGILSGHTSTAKSRWGDGWNRKMGGVSVST
jgi:hypothetical protein